MQQPGRSRTLQPRCTGRARVAHLVSVEVGQLEPAALEGGLVHLFGRAGEVAAEVLPDEAQAVRAAAPEGRAGRGEARGMAGTLGCVLRTGGAGCEGYGGEAGRKGRS